jgi:hypothetical protein
VLLCLVNYKGYSLVHPYAPRGWHGSSFVSNGASFVFVSTSRSYPYSAWLLVDSGAALLVTRGFWLIVEQLCLLLVASG